jgi:hypothetical protein
MQPRSFPQPVFDPTEIHCACIEAQTVTLLAVRLVQIVVRVNMKKPRSAHSARQVVEGLPAVRVARWGLMRD